MSLKSIELLSALSTYQQSSHVNPGAHSKGPDWQHRAHMTLNQKTQGVPKHNWHSVPRAVLSTRHHLGTQVRVAECLRCVHAWGLRCMRW